MNKPIKKVKKAFKIKLGDIASTNEANFLEEMRELKNVKVIEVIKSAVPLKARVSGIQGKRFVSIQGKSTVYDRIGFDLFAKAVLATNPKDTPLSELEYELESESLISKIENFGSPINEAFNRQVLKLKEKVEAQKLEKASQTTK